MVRRRGVAAGARELKAVLTRLQTFEDIPHVLPARWLHSYALREADGSCGLACAFDAAGDALGAARATLMRVQVGSDHRQGAMANGLLQRAARDLEGEADVLKVSASDLEQHDACERYLAAKVRPFARPKSWKNVCKSVWIKQYKTIG